LQSLLHFYSGQPLQNLSGVDKSPIAMGLYASARICSELDGGDFAGVEIGDFGGRRFLNFVAALGGRLRFYLFGFGVSILSYFPGNRTRALALGEVSMPVDPANRSLPIKVVSAPLRSSKVTMFPSLSRDNLDENRIASPEMIPDYALVTSSDLLPLGEHGDAG
jgi:hypothetical protein